MSLRLSKEEIESLQLLGQGSEAKVYSYSDTIAIKIFRNNASKKEEKLTPMLKVAALKKVSSIAWPLDDVRDENNHFVGYAMRKAPNGACTIHDFLIRKLYKLDPISIIDFLIQLADKLRRIHMSGFIVGDFNPKNFMVDPNGGVFICDVDNYQYVTKSHKRFNPEVASSEYMAKSLQECLIRYKKPSDFPDATFNLRTDAFGLAVLTFQLLMNGIHPYHGFGTDDQVTIEYNILNDYAPYFGRGNVNDIKENMPPIEVLSRGLRFLLEEVFFKNTYIDGINFEIRLIEELKDYAQSLTRSCSNSRTQHHYLPTLEECPWCRLTRIKIKLDEEQRIRKKNQEKTNSMNLKSLPSNNTNHKIASVPRQTVIMNSSPKPQTLTVNNAVQPPNATGMNTAPSTGHIKKINSTVMQNQLKQDRIKFFWLVVVFLVVGAIDIYALASGSLKEFYEAEIGTDSVMIFAPFAPYIHVVIGLLLCWFVSYIFFTTNFTLPVTILMDIGAQLGIYYLLLELIAICTAIASLIVIGAIIIGVLRLFMEGL